jgi:molybdopterin synthase sulfur carrier subunit
MSISIRIPPALRTLTNGVEVVMLNAAEAPNIGALLAVLEQKHPGFRERICDEKGQVRRFINIYLNEEDIRFLDGLNTTLSDGQDVSILPAVAGG